MNGEAINKRNAIIKITPKIIDFLYERLPSALAGFFNSIINAMSNPIPPIVIKKNEIKGRNPVI